MIKNMKFAVYFFVLSLTCIKAQSNSFSLFQRFCRNPSNQIFQTVCQQAFGFTPRTQPPTRSPIRRPPPPRRPIISATTPQAGTAPRANISELCRRPSRRCTEGKLLGDLFSANFLAPEAGGSRTTTSSNGAFPSGGRTIGSSTSGRTTGSSRGGSVLLSGGRMVTSLSAGSTINRILSGIQPNRFVPALLGPGSAPSTGRSQQLGRGGGRTLITPPCQKRFITDANNRIIAGACVTTNKTTPSPTPTGSSGNSRAKRQLFSQYNAKRDLLIMMDESGSVGYVRFQKVKRIAAAIVRLLCQEIRVHPQYTRVAVMSFDSQVHFHIQLLSPRQYSYLDYDGNALANFIYQRIRYNSRSAGSTCLINALEQAYNQALGSRFGGRRGQLNVAQDIIIISDGCENCVRPGYVANDRIRQITSFFISQNINVYVIGIGIREQCKETLSLLAQGGKCFHFFYLNNWDYIVDDFLRQLEFPPSGLCLNTFEAAEGQCLSNFG